MTRSRLLISVLALWAVPSLVQSIDTRPADDRCADPAVGFGLVSFANFGSDGETVWRNAVEDLRAHGICHVALCPVRFVDPDTGAIAATSDRGPDLSHVAAAAAAAKSLGMVVTLNPFVEIEGFKSWRGDFNPASGSEVAARFWSDYRVYLMQAAAAASRAGVDFMTIGSELRSVTNDSRHRANVKELIDVVDAVFQGRLGYAANWDEFENEHVTAAIWEHPAIDFIGIDAYFSLADAADADGSGPHPDRAFIAAMAARWNRLLDARILPFARARRGGQGLPVVLTEVGLTPYRRTTVAPHQASRLPERMASADEQVNGYQAILEGIRGRAGDLLAVYAWHWGMPGGEDSAWYLHPNGADNRPNSPHDEALGNRAALLLVQAARAGLAPDITAQTPPASCPRTCGSFQDPRR